MPSTKLLIIKLQPLPESCTITQCLPPPTSPLTLYTNSFVESTFVAFLKFRVGASTQHISVKILKFMMIQWLLSVAFAVSAVLDVFIATILSITLYKSQTGIKRLIA